MDPKNTILPLQGVRVLELCNVAAGPFCGLLLADMGLLTSGGVSGLAKRPKG